MNVCIVAHFAYPALAGDATGHIGGVEHQTTLLACWLATRGHRVSLITWDEGQPDHCVIGGVRVIKLCRQREGFPGVRFFHPRWTSLNAALRKANAEVYYQNCGEVVTGQVALWCKKNRRKFVYSVAALADCDVNLPLMHTRREKFLYRLGLRLADEVIVQTRTQFQMLQEGFTRDSRIIPMPCRGPGEYEFIDRNFPLKDNQRLLWVGRISKEKRPDLFLQIAQKNPQLQFDLVGPSSTSAYSDEVLAFARQLPNVAVHGRVMQSRLSEFYQRAACLCCTSDHEGFPNVFLEAWSYGLPIVSTLDPDGLIARQGLGYIATDVESLSTSLRQLFSSPEKWLSMSQQTRNYYLKNHHAENILPQFEDIFSAVLKSSRS